MGGGGAVYLANGTIAFSTVTFKNNEAYQIGGALVVVNATATFNRYVLFEGNKSTGSAGGAINAKTESKLYFLDDVSLKNNESKTSGGAIYMDKSTATFSGDSLFEGNKSLATVGGGGAIYAGNSSYLSFVDVFFKKMNLN